MSGHPITINCGGTLFAARRDTLIQGSDYFRALLSGNFSESLEEEDTKTTTEKTYFLDLDPDHFRLLLNRMRYGAEYLLPGDPKSQNGLKQAAEFLGMDCRNPDDVCETDSTPVLNLGDILKTRDKVICTDSVGRACHATIVESSSDAFLISYDHWEKIWNEWVPKTSSRLVAFSGALPCKCSKCCR